MNAELNDFTIRTIKDDVTGEFVTTVEMNGEALPGVRAYAVHSSDGTETEVSITFGVNSLDVTEGPYPNAKMTTRPLTVAQECYLRDAARRLERIGFRPPYYLYDEPGYGLHLTTDPKYPAILIQTLPARIQ